MKKITFLLVCVMTMSFAHAQLTSVAIVGDGVGGWPGSAGNPGPTDINQMTSSDGIHWSIANLTVTAGAAKFRGNNAWDLPYNWGGTTFSSGTAIVNGGDISTTAGTYNVSFNSDTFAYTFVLVTGGALTSVAIVGSGAGGWPGDAGNPGPVDVHQMGTVDGVNWTLNNLTLTTGAVKFRGNNSWDEPYNWGGTTFPSGTGSVNGPDIPTTAGTYNVSFNSTTNVYAFGSVLGIDEQNSSFFRLYPNPTNNVWNFNSSTVIIQRIELYDILGKNIISITPNRLEANVDASNLAKGIYIAKIIANNNTATVRLIKE